MPPSEAHAVDGPMLSLVDWRIQALGRAKQGNRMKRTPRI